MRSIWAIIMQRIILKTQSIFGYLERSQCCKVEHRILDLHLSSFCRFLTPWGIIILEWLQTTMLTLVYCKPTENFVLAYKSAWNPTHLTHVLIYEKILCTWGIERIEGLHLYHLPEREHISHREYTVSCQTSQFLDLGLANNLIWAGF